MAENAGANKKVIPINTTEEKFYLEYLKIFKPVLESLLSRINKEETTLTNKELCVTSQLLMYHNRYPDLPADDRSKLILNYNTRLEIRNKFNLSEPHLNNMIYRLKKKGVLALDGSINKIFMVNMEGGFELVFKFEVNGEASR